MLVVVREDGDAEVAVLSEQRGPLQLGAHGHGVTVIGAPSQAVSLLLPTRRHTVAVQLPGPGCSSRQAGGFHQESHH